ncbi:MAG: hypothetical protein JWR32_6264, partial [Mycobacterium sp.]|nr:hypothetical protein [Mycobacterium sp.]
VRGDAPVDYSGIQVPKNQNPQPP